MMKVFATSFPKTKRLRIEIIDSCASRTFYLTVAETQSLIEALQAAIAPFIPSASEADRQIAPYREPKSDDGYVRLKTIPPTGGG